MTQKILLTSFDTWMPHQKSNSSDDLLAKISQLDSLPKSLTFLRKLPVDYQLASNRVISKIKEMQPGVIICCGMAEGRKNLTVESQATRGEEVLKTSVNLQELVAGLAGTTISHNAGKFVCEWLYYSVLKYLSDLPSKSECIFVHVPVLTPENTAAIATDFVAIIQRLAASLPSQEFAQ